MELKLFTVRVPGAKEKKRRKKDNGDEKMDNNSDNRLKLYIKVTNAETALPGLISEITEVKTKHYKINKNRETKFGINFS